MKGKSSRSVKGSQCYKCQGCSHVAAQCPFRNLLIKEVDDDKIETVVHEVIVSATDSDDDVRVASIQLDVIRCLHTTVSNEVWRRSSVFYTYIAHEGKNYKLIIDVGSCANIITKTALEKMGLRAEPHPTYTM